VGFECEENFVKSPEVVHSGSLYYFNISAISIQQHLFDFL
jgi:hypothetical protein